MMEDFLGLFNNENDVLVLNLDIRCFSGRTLVNTPYGWIQQTFIMIMIPRIQHLH